MAVPKSKRSLNKVRSRRSLFSKQFISSKLNKKLFFISKTKQPLDSSCMHLKKKNIAYNNLIIKFRDIEKQLKTLRNS